MRIIWLLKAIGKLVLTGIYGFVVFHIIVQRIPNNNGRHVLPNTHSRLNKNATFIQRDIKQTTAAKTTTRATEGTTLRPKITVKKPKTMNFSHPLNIDMFHILRSIEKNKDFHKNIKIINPHPFSYTLNPNVCSKYFGVNDDAFSLLVLIKSAAKYFKKREAVRQTWGNFTSKFVRMAFLLGASSEHQKEIQKESSRYLDIIQEDFVDAYQNNTHKTIMGFNWAVKYCTKARYIFFVDDDYIVNMPNIINFLKRNGHDRLFTGFLLPKSTPYRDKGSKWYVSWKDYPHGKWPPYLAGGAYLVAMEVAKMFHYVFPYVRYLTIDDSYLGIVALKLGIKPEHNKFLRMGSCHRNFLRGAFGCHQKMASSIVYLWRQLHGDVKPISKTNPKM